MRDAFDRALCAALSRLLRYPGAATLEEARAAGRAAGSGPAAAPLARFADGAGALAPSALEELYTSTFDLDAACTPYVGHLLLGDGPQRGPFLARLVEVYRDGGFTAGEELPDHLAEAFAFLAMAPPSVERDDLVADGLRPALEKAVASLEDRRNPYRELLLAAQAALQPAPRALREVRP